MNQSAAFVWHHFLALAQQWSADPTTSEYAEALYRSIISRSYYAAYHSAEELALQLGMESTASASDHYRVRKFFSNRGRIASQLSATLSDLYSLRIDADYLLVWRSGIARMPELSAQKSLDLSNKVIELIGYLQPKQPAS